MCLTKFYDKLRYRNISPLHLRACSYRVVQWLGDETQAALQACYKEVDIHYCMIKFILSTVNSLALHSLALHSLVLFCLALFSCLVT